LTTKFLIPPGVRDGATSPDAERRAGRGLAVFAAAGLFVGGDAAGVSALTGAFTGALLLVVLLVAIPFS
jgi:hypothetical protein